MLPVAHLLPLTMDFTRSEAAPGRGAATSRFYHLNAVATITLNYFSGRMPETIAVACLHQHDTRPYRFNQRGAR